MRLENAEPKCANCKYWAQDGRLITFGACKLVTDLQLELQTKDGVTLIVGSTTDLSVCSKWEQKE